MFEKVIFAIISVIIAGFAVSLLEGLGTLIFPIPSDIDAQDIESLRANMHRIPLGAKVVVLIAHMAGAAAAAHLGARLTRTARIGWICGAIMLVLVLMDLFLLPHPMWFNIADPLAAVLGAIIGMKTLPAVLDQG